MTTLCKILFSFLAFTFLLFVSTLANADECTNHEKVKSDVAKLFPNATFTDMTPKQGKDFVAAWDSEPPVTDDKADAVSVVDDPTTPRIALIFFKKGCVSKVFFPFHETFNRIAGRSL